MTDLSNICQIAKAEIIHLHHRVEALQAILPHEVFTASFVRGSITLQSPEAYGYKLNNTYGFGLFGPVKEADLLEVEKTYENHGFEPQLYICEHADKTAFDMLSTRYSATGTICQYQRHLSDFDFQPTDFGEVEVFSSSDREAFVRASVEGFRDTGRSPGLLKILAESAVARPDTKLFLATLGGEVVGTAAMAMVEVDECRVAIFYGDSCVPTARRRGVHQALLLTRLEVAHERNCDFATVGAREGSGSGRNIQKAGFKQVYTCKIYNKSS